MDNSEAVGRWLFLALCVSTLVILVFWGTDVLPNPPAAGCDPDCVGLEDLSAQRSMAIAAWAMVMVSAVSVIVAVATLIIILESLREARQVTAEAARSAAAAEAALTNTLTATVAQVRAYLTVTGVEILLGTDYDTQVFVAIFNAGQSPARHMEVHVTLSGHTNGDMEEMDKGHAIFSKPWELLFDAWDGYEAEPDLPGGQSRSAEIAIYEEWTEEIGAAAESPPAVEIRARGEIRYLDVFNETRTENFNYRLLLLFGDQFPWGQRVLMARREIDR